MSARLKLFIALEPPYEWLASFVQTQEWLRHRGFERLNWIAPERIHLSLVSVGRIEERCIEQITESMERAAEHCEPFALQVDELHLFSQVRRPAVLWAGVRGEVAALDRLRQTVQCSMHASPVSPAGHRFIPHMTLAYVPYPLRESYSDRLREGLARIPLPATEPFTVRRIALIHSMTGAGRPSHRRIASAVVGIEEHGC